MLGKLASDLIGFHPVAKKPGGFPPGFAHHQLR
jgi:hypothetical protein